MKKEYIYILILSLIVIACGGPEENKEKTTGNNKNKEIKIPQFNADSAYAYIPRQVEFGPRVPNTPEHAETAKYLAEKLGSFTDTVIIQPFKARAFDGTVLNGKNIIGTINPNTKNRILLCAHWDCRPFADYDPDPTNHETAIDGANDGASGVGVLLEVARQLNIQQPDKGIDIIFFDAEDYGPPRDLQQTNDETNWWALGSQHWARNPHDHNYHAKYGILLDMVGAKDAKFYFEGYSLYYAPKILKKIWKAGHKAGYKDYFLFKQMGYINDDHIPINEYLGIPTIDIIHQVDNSSNSSFFEHWHTVHDNMDAIDKKSLKAVGQTLLTVIYDE